MAGGYPTQQSNPGRGCLMRLAPLAIACVIAAVVAFSQCQEGPFGRKQLVGLNPEQEKQLGGQAFQQVLQENRGQVIERGPAADAVRQITSRLVKATANPEFLRGVGLKAPPDYQWAVQLIDSQEMNAFCLPGGKMVVYTGIMPVAETFSGLATVMGHEISHALAHHGAERMAQSQIANILLGGAAGSLSDMSPGQQQQVMQVLNAGAKFGILSYSRKHESEADHMGLILMAAAGYDPRQAIAFWGRMQDASKGRGQPPEFMSTHPSHETRIHDLKKWLPEAMPLFQANPAPNADAPLPRP